MMNSYHASALRGEKPAAHPDDPQAGFYRIVNKDKATKVKTSMPVAYYPDNGDGFGSGLICHVNGKPVSDERGVELWSWCCDKPITEAIYQAVVETGVWPDEASPIAKLGDNQMPDEASFEALSELIRELVKDAEKELKGKVETQQQADHVANLADRLLDAQKKADIQRKAEKAPYEEGAKQVQIKWNPLIEMASVYRVLKSTLLTPFLTEQDRIAEAARKAAEKANEPIPAAAKDAPRAGTRGTKRASLTTVQDVEITDRGKVLKFFADTSSMTDFLQGLAEKAVRAGVKVPGVKITERKVAR